MQEYWENYMKPIDGHKAMISFNAGVSDFVPDESMMYVGFVKVKLKEPKEDGLVSEYESDDINFIEDRLEMESLRYRSGKYIGRIISNGEVNFIYYLRMDFEWYETVASAMKHFSGYEYESGSRLDAQWDVYQKLLFPTIKQWQIIANHHACNNLQNQGDSLKTPRAIEHKVYFIKESDSKEFIEKITSEGFTIQKESTLEYNSKEHFCVHFYRKDSAYYYDIDEITMAIIDIANSCDGQYDGWESSLVKD
jgi:regulator of RNase E activity RraB